MSVTHLDINYTNTYGNDRDENKALRDALRAKFSIINASIDRNRRFRRLFLFDARQMLLSLMCADECGVVWPYLLAVEDLGTRKAPGVVETLRAGFAVVVAKRRRRAAAAAAVEL
jgi:hypothetical protein